MGITVLSLFDGISCGQIALERAGIKVDRYYASEIKKCAIETTMRNYPGTIQIGDVRKAWYNDGILHTENGDFNAKTGETTGKGVFTIVEVKAGQGASAGWGRLKSGAGWISLDYATRLA